MYLHRPTVDGLPPRRSGDPWQIAAFGRAFHRGGKRGRTLPAIVGCCSLTLEPLNLSRRYAYKATGTETLQAPIADELVNQPFRTAPTLRNLRNRQRAFVDARPHTHGAGRSVRWSPRSMARKRPVPLQSSQGSRRCSATGIEQHSPDGSTLPQQMTACQSKQPEPPQAWQATTAARSCSRSVMASPGEREAVASGLAKGSR